MVMTHVGPMVFGGERDQSLCDPHLYLLDCGQEFGVVRHRCFLACSDISKRTDRS